MDDTDDVIKAFKILSRCGIRIASIETQVETNYGTHVGPITTTFKFEGINIKVDSGRLGLALNNLMSPNSDEDFIV